MPMCQRFILQVLERKTYVYPEDLPGTRRKKRIAIDEAGLVRDGLRYLAGTTTLAWMIAWKRKMK